MHTKFKKIKLFIFTFIISSNINLYANNKGDINQSDKQKLDINSAFKDVVIPTEFDCFLDASDSDIDLCQVLPENLFSSLRFISEVELLRVTEVLEIKLRSIQQSQGVLYRVKFARATYGQGEYEILIKNANRDQSVIILTNWLIKLTLPYGLMEAIKKNENGDIEAIFSGDGGGRSGNNQKNEGNPFFVSVTFQGQYNFNQNMHIFANANAQYRNDKVVAIIYAYGWYDQAFFTENGRLIEPENIEDTIVYGAGTGFAASYNVLKNFAIAVVGRTATEPNPNGDNTDFMANGGVAMQWLLVPFSQIGIDDFSAGASYYLRANYFNYTVPNIQSKNDNSFVSHNANAFVNWHIPDLQLFDQELGSLDTLFKIEGFTTAESFDYASGKASTEVTYSPFNFVDLIVSGNVSYTRYFLHKPLIQEAPTGLVNYAGFKNFSNFGFGVNGSIRFYWGDQQALDRRWR